MELLLVVPLPIYIRVAYILPVIASLSVPSVYIFVWLQQRPQNPPLDADGLKMPDYIEMNI